MEKPVLHREQAVIGINTEAPDAALTPKRKNADQGSKDDEFDNSGQKVSEAMTTTTKKEKFSYANESL